MSSIILVLLVLAALGVFIGAGILNGLSKAFKLNEVKYAKSLIITILTFVASLVAGVIFGIINLGILSNVLATVAAFLAFHFLLKKYFQSSWGKSLGIYILNGILTLIVALIIIVPIRLYIAEPFIVKGDSMSPIYNEGDYLVISKLTMTFQRGDIVVMKIPNTNNFVLKRIVGLPNEHVEVKNQQVFVNGVGLTDSYAKGEIYGGNPVKLGTNEYYMLGDNHTKSADSRTFGAVKAIEIQGKALTKIEALSKPENK